MLLARARQTMGDQEAALGDVAVGGQVSLHVLKPDAGADAGDQVGQPVGGTPRLYRADLFDGQRLDKRCLQPDLVDAETRVHLGHAAFEQRQDAHGIAHCRGQAQFDLLAALIDAAQSQLQPACAHPLRFEPGAERLKQPGSRGHHVRHKADWVGEGQAQAEMWRVGLGRDRLGHIAQGLIEPRQKRRAEAARKGRARGGAQIRDGAQAKPLQAGADRLVQPQRRDRQRGERAPRLAHRGDARAEMRQRPGRAARIGQPQPQLQPGPRDARPHILQHGLFAAPQMGRSGHVQHQPVRPLAPDPGAIAPRPTPQCQQEARIAPGLGGAADQVGAEGAGVGQAHGAVQAQGLGAGVEAVDTLGIALPKRQRKGRLNRACPQNPVGGQPGKPHANDAFPDSIEHARPQVFPLCS